LAHAKQTKQDTVVVIDQDINSNNFDIDYEIEGHLLRKVFSDQKVVDYLIDHLKKQNIKKKLIVKQFHFNYSESLYQKKHFAKLMLQIPNSKFLLISF
jgi:hypothetical protein